MSKWIFPFLLLFVCNLSAQPIFPPASQAEVDTGTQRNKFVSPFTLQQATLTNITVTATNAIARNTGYGTNITIQGLSLSNLVASRVLALNAAFNVTNSGTAAALFDNFFLMGITNILAASGIALQTNNGVLWITNTGGGGGGGGGSFNVDQFAATSVTNIKSGALLTNISSLNITNRGALTNLGAAGIGGQLNVHTIVNDGPIFNTNGYVWFNGFGSGLVFSNELVEWHSEDLIFTTINKRIEFRNGGGMILENGSGIRFNSDPDTYGDLAGSLIFGTNSSIISSDVAEAADEDRRYRFVRDRTGALSNLIARIRDINPLTNLLHSGTLILSNNPGLWPLLRFAGTNGQLYTEITITNSVPATNRIVLSIGGTITSSQALKIHSVTASGGLNIIVLTNDVISGGSGFIPFLVDQFETGGGVTNIKSGALVTNLSTLNLTNRGILTQSGSATFTSGATFNSPVTMNSTLDTIGIGHLFDDLNVDGGVSIGGRAYIIGLQTNANNVRIQGGASGGTLIISRTNGNIPQVILNSYSNAAPQVILQRHRDTEQAPTAIKAGDQLGQLEFLGYGASNLRSSFMVRPEALSDFTGSSAETLAKFRIGNNSTSVRDVWDLSPYVWTNRARTYMESNVNFIAGALFPNLTATRVLFLNSAGVVTNVTSAAPSTEFVHADGTVGTPGGAGDVVGPASSTDNALVKFDSTTGKLIQQNNGVILSDSSALTGVESIRLTNDVFLGAARIFHGQNSPESVVTANIGSLFLQTNASLTSSLWSKTNNNGASTGWWLVQGGGGGGSALFNADQFLPSSTHTNIKSGALVTNLSTLNLTNRADFTNVGNVGIAGSTLVNGLSVQGSIAASLTTHSLGGLTVSDITANRVVTADGSSKLSATAMRMANDFTGVSDGHGLIYNAASGTWTNGAVGGSGEVNTASSLGNGLHLFSDKSGVDLRFNTLSNLNNTIQIVSNNNVFHLAATNIGAAQMSLPGTANDILFRNNVDLMDATNDFEFLREASGEQYVNINAINTGLRLKAGSTAATYYNNADINASNSASFQITAGPGGASSTWRFDDTLEALYPTVGNTLLLGATNGAEKRYKFVFANIVDATNVHIIDSIRLNQNSGRGYTEITATNLGGISTNRIELSIGSNTVSAGQVLKVHATTIASGVNKIVLTNDTDSVGGGGGGNFNINQFSASSTHTNIKDGVLLTNAVNHGWLTTSNIGIALITTNGARIPVVSGTNIVIDGGLGSYFQWHCWNTTNYGFWFTNIGVGQVLQINTWATNGSTIVLGTDVSKPFTNSWYYGGDAVGINSNCLSTIFVSRTGLYGDLTNVYVITRDYSLGSAGGLVLHTNFSNGLITISNSISSSYLTNDPVRSLGYLHVTNQIMYVDEFFNGGGAATNLSFDGSIIKNQTNAITGDRTYTLTNAAGGRTMVVHLRAETATATDRLIKFTNANDVSSTTILWRSPTNGSYDFIAHSNATYTIFFTVLTNNSSGTKTNILAQWNTDSARTIQGAAFAVSGGSGSSNAFLGGRMWVSDTKYTNWNASTLTNMASITIPANTLTNLYDEIEVLAHGKAASGVGTNKWFQLQYGSSTNLIDTGWYPMSNGTWRATARILRTGNTSQSWIASFFYPHGGVTNFSGTLSETNGIATVLKMQIGLANSGGFTNEQMLVNWTPGPR